MGITCYQGRKAESGAVRANLLRGSGNKTSCMSESIFKSEWILQWYLLGESGKPSRPMVEPMCSVFFSVSGIHVGGFAAGRLLGNGEDKCNPVAAELHSEKGLSLWGMLVHIAGVSHPAGCRADHSGARRVTAAPQPFCRESIAGRATSDSAG
ncbi:hypothetical protein Q5P01_022328 [Channa striata]|uniref:Uncharacterized protein n=1 Tax=Channa striata TaxID=64152 RepID=A0AA88IWY7_CHASR|nr:hypothetical protein Q5P01_022328 [Channa striata]